MEFKEVTLSELSKVAYENWGLKKENDFEFEIGHLSTCLEFLLVPFSVMTSNIKSVPVLKIYNPSVTKRHKWLVGYYKLLDGEVKKLIKCGAFKLRQELNEKFETKKYKELHSKLKKLVMKERK